MKKLLIGLGLAFILLIVVILLLPFLIDLNKYQDQYRPLIEEALDRKVSLKEIRLTIFPRLGVRLAEFSILDDPNFSSDPFLSLTSLDLGVKLRPLLSKRVEVEEITLRNPMIKVIKNRKGIMNISTIGEKSSTKSDTPTPPQETPAKEGPSPLLALLAVERSNIIGGNLSYHDQSTQQSTTYELQDLNLQLTSVGLNQTPTIHVDTLVQPFKLPVTVDGTVGPLKETGDLEKIDLDLSLGKTNMAVDGSMVGGVTKLTVTSPEVNTANLPLSLPLQKPVQLTNLDVQAELTDKKVHLHNMSFQTFEGTAKAVGALGLGSDAPPFKGDITLQGFQLGPLLETVGTGKVSVSGTAGMEFSLQGQGFSMPQLTRSLTGTGHMLVKDGKVEGLNVLQEAFRLLKRFGINPETVQTDVFSAIEGNIAIKQGVVNVQRLQVDSPDLQALTKGTVGFDQKLNLQANITLSEILSQKIAGKSPAAKIALTKGQLTIPLIITGTAQTPSYNLDSKKFGSKVQEQVKEKVEKAVDDLLKGKASPKDLLKQGQDTFKQFFGQ